MREEQRERTRNFMEADFLPVSAQGTDAQYRVASALEYAAYHLGQIDKKLGRIIEELHTSNS